MRAEDLEHDRTVYRQGGKASNALHLYENCPNFESARSKPKVAGDQFDDEPVCSSCASYERRGMWRRNDSRPDNDLRKRLLNMDADEVP